MDTPAQTAAWKDEVAQHLRPTMLIGLGGSGKDVLLRVRRLFYERQGRNPDGSIGYPIIGYLALDTDPGSRHAIEGESTRDIVLKNIDFQPGEFLNCSMSESEVTHYFRGGRDQYRHIFSWLRPEVETYGAGGAAAATGAGQNRQLARLAFFHHFAGTADRPGIRPTLERRLQHILDQARVPQLKKAWKPKNADVAENELDVVLVYSLAGGTGAGMFLDMGMLVRELVRGMGLEGLRAYFTHFVLLPEPFLGASSKLAPEERTKIQENAYAALREMEYFSRRIDRSFDLTIPPDLDASASSATGTPWYQVQWEKHGKVYAIDSAPWDTCYLVGGSNDPLGSPLAPQDVYQMTAEFIFLDFDPNQFGTRRRMRRPNIQGRLLEDAVDPVSDSRGTLYNHLVSRRYSTFGLSQVYFDRARMRRAASYRLAVTLLDYWMRPPTLMPPTRKDYANRDIPQGVLMEGEKEAALQLTFDRVRDLLLLKDSKSDRQRRWLQDIEDELRTLRDKLLNADREGPAGPALLDELMAQHQERLRRHPLGGKEGVVRESILANAAAVKKEIESRLRRLFLRRVQELGVRETRLLLEDYGELLQPQILRADQWTRLRVDLSPLWRDRVDEARRLPDWLVLLRPARKAVQAEMVRGLREVGKYLRNRYTFEASEEVRSCLQLAADRVGRSSASASEAAGSYTDLLDRFSDLHDRTRSYLEGRFADLRKDDQSQRRTRGMLEHWDDKMYNREIETFLTRSNEGRHLLQRVEVLVLEQLRAQKGQEEVGKWDSVDSLGRLILQVLPLNKGSKASESLVEEFARDLANACWALLEGFCKDRSALELFNAERDDQQDILEVLRKYSAPFLRRHSAANQAEGADSPSLIQLGVSNHNSDEARKFQEKLRASARDGQTLTSLEAFGAQDDAVILCQEKHGLPLYYYQFLEDLGRQYYGSAKQPERHFDFNFLQDRLPEIRKIDFEKQRHLGNCLELTLQGVMTGLLYWKEDQFWLSYSIGRNAPREEHAQGNRLESIIHRLAENVTEQQKLTEQVTTWIQSARQGEGAKLALLWCSVADLVAEVSRRAAALTRKAGTGTPTKNRSHPLVSILCTEDPAYTGLLPKLRDQLEGMGNGVRWVDSRIDRFYLEQQYPNDYQALLVERERLLRPCYLPTNPGGLPIRVIKREAQLHLDSVQFPGKVRISRAVPDPAPQAGAADTDGDGMEF